MEYGFELGSAALDGSPPSASDRQPVRLEVSAVLRSSHWQLKRAQFAGFDRRCGKLFAKPAYTTTEGRKPILNLAMAMQHRQWMKGLWDEATQFDLPVKFTAHHPTGTG